MSEQHAQIQAEQLKDQSLSEVQTSAAPFLRWAGGKSWLAERLTLISTRSPSATYYEPFLGGGAVFFAHARSSLQATLSDSNEQLIDTYRSVRDAPEQVIKRMRRYVNTEECYYATRASKPANQHQRAARFIYLNQTSFNGIFRVNLRGEYNVPYGRRKKDFLQPETIRAASSALANATLKYADFEEVIKHAEAGDVVFADPPYTVSHNKNGFIKYNESLFSLNDQRRLAAALNEAVSRGVSVILSNADHPEVLNIFKGIGKHYRVQRRNVVGGALAKRGRVSEVVITNMEVDL